MRQVIRFEAVNFHVGPVEVEMEEGAEPPEDGSVPAAVMVFEGGSVQVQVPLTNQDADGLMNAFTQAEPHRGQIPDNHGWEPLPAELPGRVFWVLTPAVVGVSVTPPQSVEDGVIPFWQLAFDDEDGSQVQVAVSDAMCVQVVRALANMAHAQAEGEAPAS